MPETPSELDFQDLLDRAVTIPVEAVGGAGKPYWFHSQEDFPYFLARIDNLGWDLEESAEMDVYEFDIVVRHISGNRTAGIPGEAEGKFYEQLPAILAAFLSSDLLQSTTYPTAPDWLESIELQPGVRMTVIDASAIGGGLQIGTDYTLRCRARLDNYQTYE